jgi:hypothetical protein
MSERLNHSEKEPSISPERSTEQLNRIREELNARAEEHKDKHISVEALSKKVEQKAVSGKEFAPNDSSERRHHPVLVNKQLKDMAYSRAMTRARKQLSLPSKLLSKAIHSKILERPSELIEKTIARPSGFLGGALSSAIGTSVLLWISNRYGYEYNYLAVILLFVCGMAIGLIIEATTKLLRKR